MLWSWNAPCWRTEEHWRYAGRLQRRRRFSSTGTNKWWAHPVVHDSLRCTLDGFKEHYPFNVILLKIQEIRNLFQDNCTCIWVKSVSGDGISNHDAELSTVLKSILKCDHGAVTAVADIHDKLDDNRRDDWPSMKTTRKWVKHWTWIIFAPNWKINSDPVMKIIVVGHCKYCDS